MGKALLTLAIGAAGFSACVRFVGPSSPSEDRLERLEAGSGADRQGATDRPEPVSDQAGGDRQGTDQAATDQRANDRGATDQRTADQRTTDQRTMDLSKPPDGSMSVCNHSPCIPGGPLSPDCAASVACVCATFPQCCTVSWDQICSSYNMSCGGNCN